MQASFRLHQFLFQNPRFPFYHSMCCNWEQAWHVVSTNYPENGENNLCWIIDPVGETQKRQIEIDNFMYCAMCCLETLCLKKY